MGKSIKTTSRLILNPSLFDPGKKILNLYNIIKYIYFENFFRLPRFFLKGIKIEDLLFTLQYFFDIKKIYAPKNIYISWCPISNGTPLQPCIGLWEDSLLMEHPDIYCWVIINASFRSANYFRGSKGLREEK